VIGLDSNFPHRLTGKQACKAGDFPVAGEANFHDLGVEPDVL